MTICDKIQTIGNTLQDNLNDRGINCIFGSGSGEKSILQMVRFVNDTNFKGSSDVILKIDANRPYLLSEESTDVIIKLENGLCEPLKNKNVIVGQSIFHDGGITSNYTNWDTVSSTIQMTRQNTYTELKRTTDATSFGYILKDLSVTDGITIEFDFKQATPSSSNDQYLSFRNNQGVTRLGISRDYQSLNDREWHHCKLVVNGLTITPIIDGVQKSNLTLSDSWSRIQLEVRNNAVLHFKNFVIYENINGVTDEKGEFALYDVSVTDDTIFTATYGTETASCKIHLCKFVDYAVTNNHNDNWSNWSSYTVNRTRTDSYTLIEPNDRTTASYQIKYINNLSNPKIIEFDCKQIGGLTNSVIFQLRGQNQSVVRQISLSTFSNLSLDTWYHWKIDLVGGTFSNVTTNQTVTFTTTGILSFFFSIFANAEHNLQYRNFVIY